MLLKIASFCLGISSCLEACIYYSLFMYVIVIVCVRHPVLLTCVGDNSVILCTSQYVVLVKWFVLSWKINILLIYTVVKFLKMSVSLVNEHFLDLNFVIRSAWKFESIHCGKITKLGMCVHAICLWRVWEVLLNLTFNFSCCKFHLKKHKIFI